MNQGRKKQHFQNGTECVPSDLFLHHLRQSLPGLWVVVPQMVERCSGGLVGHFGVFFSGFDIELNEFRRLDVCTVLQHTLLQTALLC